VFSGGLQVWVPMERFDEALLLLRHTLRWELLDCLYARLFDSRREDATRWDGKLILPTPKVQARPGCRGPRALPHPPWPPQALDPALVARIRALNTLDTALYDAAVAAYDTALADAMGPPGSRARAAWEADEAELGRMLAALAASLGRAEAGCVALRQWYGMSDVEYEASVGDDGFAAVPLAATAAVMRAAYEARNKTRFC